MQAAIRESVLVLLGETPDNIVLVAPYTVLKTSSGKIRRSACKEIYERRGHTNVRRSTLVQIIRLWSSALMPELGAFSRRILEGSYAMWWGAWGFILLGAVVFPAASIVPSRRFAQAWVGFWGRIFLNVVFARPKLKGAKNLLHSGPLVIAANHTSYLDGLLILALCPRPVRFVAKNTLERSWLGPLLRNLGTLFVERFDVRKGAAGTKPIRDTVAAGDAVVFFPEGTFGRMPGLLPFRMGAFAVAAETGAPVLPLALCGLRTMLRSEVWFPRRAEVSLHAGELVVPTGSGWGSALGLRDSVRAQLLEYSGEADLRFETGEVEKLREKEIGTV